MGPPCKIVLLLEGVLKNAKAFIPFAEKTKTAVHALINVGKVFSSLSAVC